MHIEEMLMAEHSKRQATEIVNYIDSDQKKFDKLFKIFLEGEYRIAQRAAWPLSLAVISNPSFINHRYPELLKKLKDKKQHEAIRRNIMRIFAELESYPEKFHGLLMDQCFHFIEDPKTKVAVQAYSMQTLSKLCKLYPEIVDEVKLIIEERMPNATAAYAASSKNFLKTVSRIKHR